MSSFWLNRSLHRGAAGPPWHRAFENEGFLWGSTAHTGGPGEMEEELGSLSRVWGSPKSHACSQSTQPYVVSQVSFCSIRFAYQRKAADPNRFSNRGGSLLKESKDRAKVQKLLPKVHLFIVKKNNNNNNNKMKIDLRCHSNPVFCCWSQNKMKISMHVFFVIYCLNFTPVLTIDCKLAFRSASIQSTIDGCTLLFFFFFSSSFPPPPQ